MHQLHRSSSCTVPGKGKGSAGKEKQSSIEFDLQRGPRGAPPGPVATAGDTLLVSARKSEFAGVRASLRDWFEDSTVSPTKPGKLCTASANPGPEGESALSGQVLPGLLVVHGSHARLNNIDSSARFLRDETFEFSGKVICRKAGSSAGNLLRAWRQARDNDPSLFRQISLMSQPSANVDGIIFAWAQEELASLAPASVHVRCGLVGSARTRPAWLRDRFSWRDASGIPLKPDISLLALHGAKVVADLVEWSYHHSESQGEALESQVSDALLNVHEMRLDLPLPHRVWRVGDASATVLLSDTEVCEASGGLFAAEPLELMKFSKSYPQMLLDQHLRYGWELLRYNLSNSDENWFLENKICMVDPKLSGQLLAEDHDSPELLQAALERLRSENKLLFVPVWGQSPNHWTLLVLQREDLSENFSVKYLDSLSEKHEECSVNAAKLLSLLLPTEVLPDRSPSGTQKSDECEFWVLANMLSIGPASGRTLCSWISRKAGSGAERLAGAALWRAVEASEGAGGQGEGSGEDSEGQPHPHGEAGKQDNKICKILAHWRPPKIGKMSSALFPSTM
eukprot:s977_g3.t1